MEHNLAAYKLFTEINHLLKTQFPNYALEPYRSMVQKVTDLQPESLPLELRDRLWHTVYMKQDLSNFIPLSPQNIVFLERLVEDLEKRVSSYKAVGGW
ncbi:hypothetical protein [Shouchella shacheensis]|uniref:hypothetical protein n=1 Tax=Shouchella shacheensis TaxID=1649580 RepID=UPI00073FDCAC|nr:hypothetical protein [Shouchella shacheensis]